uniref:Transposase n=1 Tax=Globodera rostochiensis TaxID=31243 RepID=A0A914HPQ7_GLORO
MKYSEKADKLNPIQLISLDKLNPSQLIRILLTQSLITLTIRKWKSELCQNTSKHKHPHSEQKELMKFYYEIKDKNTKIRDVDIVKLLKIGTDTLVRWKRQFKRQQFHPNSVDGHFVEENAAANVQEIGNSNSGST